jgi:hypothetical protein
MHQSDVFNFAPNCEACSANELQDEELADDGYAAYNEK